jgi:hypothetical protein
MHGPEPLPISPSGADLQGKSGVTTITIHTFLPLPTRERPFESPLISRPILNSFKLHLTCGE